MTKNSYSTFFFTVFSLGIVGLAWLERDEYWFSADSGLGYAFGIVGSSMMLLLLLYPARKYWKPMRNMLRVHHWFRLHMMFGVLGPIFILLHSNFRLGSLNSSIALFSMLLVASSGVLGRYVYQKFHRGLYGEQIAYADLDTDYQLSKQYFNQSSFFSPEIQQELLLVEDKLTQRNLGVFISLSLSRKISRIKGHLQYSIKQLAKQKSTLTGEQQKMLDNDKHLISGLSKLEKMASYALYTRLFSLWHVFHLPIFFMMIIAAVVHIFVVHIY